MSAEEYRKGNQMNVVDRMARLAMIAHNGVNRRGLGNVPYIVQSLIGVQGRRVKRYENPTRHHRGRGVVDEQKKK